MSAMLLRIEEPVHGAVLHHRHGRQDSRGLEVRVRGTVRPGDLVTVNGVPAMGAGGRFEAQFHLEAAVNVITASSDGPAGREVQQVQVLWDRHSRPRYRFAIDDNIYFLRELARSQPRSLFAIPYLAALRALHRRFGTRFVLNLFYTTPDADFNLAQVPDLYRAEWCGNADWLRLAFHAHAEFPDRPYEEAPPEILARDFDQVAAQILRFAGETAYSPPSVIHWGMVSPAAWPVLKARDVTVLSGFFVPARGSSYTADGEQLQVAGPADRYDINYGLDAERSEYLSRHDLWHDFGSGFTFSKIDLVCNNTPAEQVGPALEPLTANPDTAEIMDIFTHEQYFWPFYQAYRPDHVQRCEAAIRFCAERGYEPVFLPGPGVARITGATAPDQSNGGRH